ncbi:MAG: hypothetical protein PHE48_02790 [Candidatus Daviesbacteria bacterium]|nr:hypothetical protein [Candidatus Daviesbacteria bacterium]
MRKEIPIRADLRDITSFMGTDNLAEALNKAGVARVLEVGVGFSPSDLDFRAIPG